MSKKMTDLQWLYAQIPSVDCKGHCWEACANIALTEQELERMREVRKTKVGPHTLVKGFRIIQNASNGQCPHLRRKKCRVYEVRPAICRLYGVAEGMECPHGCRPARMLTSDEGSDILDGALRLSRKRK